MEPKEFDRNLSLIKWSSDPYIPQKKQRIPQDITVYIKNGLFALSVKAVNEALLHVGSKVRVGFNPTNNELYITQDDEATINLFSRNYGTPALAFSNKPLARYFGIEDINGTFLGKCVPTQSGCMLIFDLTTPLLRERRKEQAPL
mgnify:FL=1